MFTSIFEPGHLIIILAVALLVLGPKRLPGAGRALGQGLREFRGSLTATADDLPDGRVGASRMEDPAPASRHPDP